MVLSDSRLEIGLGSGSDGLVVLMTGRHLCRPMGDFHSAVEFQRRQGFFV